MSFAPGELSTIEGTAGATKAFDFGDLPCPPPNVASADWWFYNPVANPTRPYEPRILPPTQVKQLDPAFATCSFAPIYQGFDPPAVLRPITTWIRPGFAKHGKHRRHQGNIVTPTSTLDRQPQSTVRAKELHNNFRAHGRRYGKAVSHTHARTQPHVITPPPIIK